MNSASAADKGIVGWGNYGTFAQVNAFRTAGSTLLNYWWSADLATPTLLINDSNWPHVAATYDGTNRRIYFDGTEEASDTPPTHNATNANFRIGSTNSAEFFNGTLDEVAIFDHTLTATEISGLANATGPLVSTVTSNSDTGAGTLREAITTAAAHPGPNVVLFASFAVPRILFGSEITVIDSEGLTIDARNTPKGITLDGDDATRLLRVVTGSRLTLHHLTLTGGSADVGGAIRSAGILTLDSCTLGGNSASFVGGAVANEFGTLILRNCTLHENTATGGGGGIFTSYGMVTVVGGNISSNQASYGGGVGSNDGCFFFTDVTIGGPTPADGNTATNDGGGLYVPGGSQFAGMDIIRGSISHNTAGINGGGCWNTSAGPPLIDGTLITNNTAGDEGGGVWTSYNTLNITNATITGNTGNTANSGNNGADDQGGGGVFHSNGTLTISNSTISGNNAALNNGNGGGIYNAANGNLTVDFTTIDGNQAYFGGGIQSDDAIAVVNNSTLSGNSATSQGGGINRDSGTLTLDSSILANNQSGTEGDSDISGDYVAATGRTSIVKAHPSGTQSGSGTILTSDPLLAPLGNYGGPTQTMLPLYGSPAIDAAANSTATTDQRELAVIGTPDLGATEYQESADLALLWPLDFDGDGSPYGAELALGTDPLVSDPGNPRNLTAPEFQPNGSVELTFGYNEFAPPGTNWVLTRSTTLLSGSFAEIARINTINPGVVGYTSNDPSPPQPAAGYRFEAEFIPPGP
ncbi:MAG: LamG domain-containing protein [Verrucomicrobia bacterium]|nr:LamG domain-containing protein [Verrucomicrobiota bacterium]